MCALINRKRKDRAKASRQKRRQEILDSARRLFARQPYGSVTLDIVGRRVGVAKGLASLHFTTREELYLEVLRLELDAWFDFMETSLGDGGAPLGGKDLSRLIVDDLEERTELAGMLRSWHCALEENVEMMPAQTFADWLHRRATSLAESLERRCAGIAPGGGLVFLRRLGAMAVGLHQTTALSGIFGAILLDDKFAAMQGEPREDLRNMIARLLPPPAAG